jgi:hypothetical protein
LFRASCDIDQERADAFPYLVSNLPINLRWDVFDSAFPPEPDYCMASKSGGMIIVFNESPNLISPFKKPQTRKTDEKITWRHLVHMKDTPIESGTNVGVLSACLHHITQPIEPHFNAFMLLVFIYQPLSDVYFLVIYAGFDGPGLRVAPGIGASSMSATVLAFADAFTGAP